MKLWIKYFALVIVLRKCAIVLKIKYVYIHYKSFELSVIACLV